MKSKSLKFKIIFTLIVVCCISCIALVSLYSSVIFERGNPIPSVKINEDTPYVQVKQTDSQTIYITKRGVCDELLQSFASQTGAELQEDFGDTYIFGDGKNKWVISSGTYMKNYTVWEVPIISDESNIS